MPHLVMAHALVSAVTVGVNVWGSVLLYDLRDVCAREGLEFESAGVFKVLVWFTWAVLILCAVLAIVPLQLVPSESSGYGAWERRWTIISWLCCCRRCASPALQVVAPLRMHALGCTPCAVVLMCSCMRPRCQTTQIAMGP